MPLVAGVDSSTQSTKVLIIDTETAQIVRQGKAPHPNGTEVDPHSWLDALRSAIAEAGGSTIFPASPWVASSTAW